MRVRFFLVSLLSGLTACTSANPNFSGNPNLDLKSGGSVDLVGADLVGQKPDLPLPSGDLAGADLVGPKTDLTGLGSDGFCIEGKACAIGDTAGLCKLGVCTPCIDPVDDGFCTFAYGSDHLCVAGSCVPGDCRSSDDCSGRICSGRLCVDCSTDPQCMSAYGDEFVCDKGSGFCSTPNDCPKVNDNTYYVDPENGSDSAGTGDSSSGCAWKTLTHALAAIGPHASQVRLILVGNGLSTELANETYPVTLSGNVLLTIEEGTGDIVAAPTSNVAFSLTGKNNIITADSGQHLIVDGTGVSGNGSTGVACQSGATATIDHLTVKGYSANISAGVSIPTGCTLTLGRAVEILDNKNGVAIGYGGSGEAGRLNVELGGGTDGDDGLFIHGNNQGILVNGTGYFTITGDGDGAVRIAGNATDNLYIAQGAGFSGQQLKTCTLSGVDVKGSDGLSMVTSNNGINVQVGSKLKVRSSTILGHQIGVRMGIGIAGDLSSVDLGTGGDFGENRLQADDEPNTGAGLCVVGSFAPNNAAKARGNLFTKLDCSANNAGKLKHNDSFVCSDAADVGYQISVAIALDPAKIIDIQNCSY